MPILAKDEDKQHRIKEKSVLDACSSKARAIGASTPATASRGVTVAGTKMSKLITPAMKPTTTDSISGISTAATTASVGVAQKTSSSSTPTGANNAKGANGLIASKKIPMVIQDIPPFRGSGKAKTSTPKAASTISNGSSTNSASNGNVAKSMSPAGGTVPLSPTTATANRLNVNATSFRPNPKANVFMHFCCSFC